MVKLSQKSIEIQQHWMTSLRNIAKTTPKFCSKYLIVIENFVNSNRNLRIQKRCSKLSVANHRLIINFIGTRLIINFIGTRLIINFIDTRLIINFIGLQSGRVKSRTRERGGSTE